MRTLDTHELKAQLLYWLPSQNIKEINLMRDKTYKQTLNKTHKGMCIPYTHAVAAGTRQGSTITNT